MIKSKLRMYSDEYGNRIDSEKEFGEGCEVIFRGYNNSVTVSPDARLTSITIIFECDNGRCEIEANRFKGKIKIGHNCLVKIGSGVTCTNRCFITVAEGASVSIGEDCMFASKNEIRAHDAHPIFDVASRRRINSSRSIEIAPHVWLAERAVILSGAVIGSGSVVGYGSVVKGRLPNNCVAVGVPAKVIRRHIAWERPNLNTDRDKIMDEDMAFINVRYWKRSGDMVGASHGKHFIWLSCLPSLIWESLVKLFRGS